MTDKLEDIMSREVIRCKDCRYFLPYKIAQPYHYCSITGTKRLEDSFCARAERKDKENE